MKKLLKRLTCLLVATIVVACISVVAISKLYYNNKFAAGIWINEIYCTGMTVSDVSDKLKKDYKYSNIMIHPLSGNDYEYVMDEKSVTIDYTAQLKEMLNKHNSSWIFHLFNGVHYNIEPEYQYDTEYIKSVLQDLDFLNSNLYCESNTVSIVKDSSKGYILEDNTKDLMQKDQTIEVILSGICNNKDYIDLTASDNVDICYKSIPYTAQMKKTIKEFEEIDKFQNFNLTYEFGDDKEVIDAGVVCGWMALDDDGKIVFDEEGKPVLDETFVKEYIDSLASKYDTVGIERSFKATSGEIVKVAGGTYGNQIDAKAEYEFLLDAFANKEGGKHTPVYLSEAFHKGEDDIGDTYVEVDKNKQMLYYYQDGELKISTPVVTGNTSRRMGTPSKVCCVYFKQRNRVLRGRDYATPVKYWIAVNGHIGIHDASWRKEFGGEIYKHNGSHGCINTPSEKVSELYDMIELGTPVIIF